ncbi:hypothetical protein BH10PLA2_BH10PLA2_17490 [soil metagenome]
MQTTKKSSDKKISQECNCWDIFFVPNFFVVRILVFADKQLNQP